MKVKVPEVGGIAQSIQGRDKGTFYVIVSSDGNTVCLADGVKRKTSDPKKKNLKHVRLLPLSAKDAGIAFPPDKASDCRIAYYLKTLNKENKSEDLKFCQKTT